MVSVPASRALCFAALAAILMTLAIITRRRSIAAAYFVILAAGLLSIGAVMVLSSRSPLFAVPPVILLATNLLPPPSPSPRPNFLSALMAVGISLVEVLFFWRYIGWLKEHTKKPGLGNIPRWLWALPAIVLSTGLAALLFNGTAAIPAEQALRLPPNARILVRNTDFNWIQLDQSRRYLFAGGHGLNHLRRYDVRNWNAPPLESSVTTGHSQSFIYDRDNGQIYIYDSEASRLLYLDANSLGLIRSVSLKEVAPGDTWLAYDQETDSISVSSEADTQTGYAFIVVNRKTGAVIDRNNDDAGSLLPDPVRHVEYLNFFRRQSGVEIYDLVQRRVTLRVPFVGHTDRMAMWRQKNRLLITEPVESRIAVLDADKLTADKNIHSLFGVRAIAVDEEAQLLLCGSLATGQLEVIDLRDEKKRARYYLGPWLRTIELVPDRGIAYVSSNGELFQVKYK